MMELDKRTSDYLVNRIRELSSFIAPVPTGIESILPKLYGVRVVLFDVYGTLLISGAGDIGTSAEGSHADAMRSALRFSGFNIIGHNTAEIAFYLLKDEIEKKHIEGMTRGIEYPEVEIREIFREVIRQLTARNLVSSETDNFLIARLAVEYECRVNPVWKMPGADEVVKCLRKKGIHLGIVSNAQFYTPLTIKALFGNEPEAMGFQHDLMVWSYIIGEAKPSTIPFRRVLEKIHTRYGIKPGECLYVGNSFVNDMIPSASLGCKTAHFAGDKRSYRIKPDSGKITAITPDAIINNLQEIDDILPKANITL